MARHRRTEVTAAIDVDGDRAAAMAKETGAEPFRSIGDALAEGSFDAGLDHGAAPTSTRSWPSPPCGAGKHVLLEKPMAPTLEACDRILAAARSAATVFLVAENAQYWPEVVMAKDLIDEGAWARSSRPGRGTAAPPMDEFHGRRQLALLGGRGRRRRGHRRRVALAAPAADVVG